MDELEVFRYGTSVVIGGEIPGIITGIMVRESKVSYEVSWWDGRTHNCKWLENCEVKVSNPTSSVLQKNVFKK